MGDMAIDEFGIPVFASDYTETEWEQYRSTNQSTLHLPCCGATAVLKTSSNGLPFFAHYSDDCVTSPESIWHLRAKEMLIQGLRDIGIPGQLEFSGGDPGQRWKADVYFEQGNQKIALEVEHSYQHYRDYQKRQMRYSLSGVQCYWVLYKKRFLTLTKSIAGYRLRSEFHGQWPSDPDKAKGIGQHADIPVVWLDPDDTQPIKAPCFFASDISQWLRSLLTGDFNYQQDGWRIRT